MITWVAVALALCGMVRSQAPEVPVVTEHCKNNEEPGAEWNCTRDHRAHPTNPNMFQQSAIGFIGLTPEQEATFIFDQRCPVIHQIFTKSPEGLCRCSYTPELNAILASECTLRDEPGLQPYQYSSINPNRNVTTIGDMWELRSCLEVLRPNQIQGFNDLGVIPMFFNLTGCRCQWTDAGLQNFIVATGINKCERLFDYVFDKTVVNGDLVGNWVEMHPFFKQNNFSLAEGGNVFDEETRAAVYWRLMATEFEDINIITSFRTFDDNNGVPQIIFSNRCEVATDNGGFIDLRYRSSTQTYTLEIFGATASCRPSNPGAPNSIQVVQVQYKVGAVSLRVNGGDCDVSSINSRDGRFEPTQVFNDVCAFQLGGRVGTDPLITGFGEILEPEAKFTGIMFFHTALRNCEEIPSPVDGRMGGIRT